MSTTTTQAYLLHALSPLHAGTGDSADVIDLPIARMKATGIPFVPGSSVKGVLRDVRKPNGGGANDAYDKWVATFGPKTEKAADHAGALVVGDARLLALPVRSFNGTFACVTSPLLLALAKRDLGTLAKDIDVPAVAARRAIIPNEPESIVRHNDKLYLQDLDLEASNCECVSKWAGVISKLAFGGADIFSCRFAVVDDDTMSYFCEMATQVDQRISIKSDTGTVADGALWLEESLPPETLLIGLMDADKSRSSHEMSPQDVKNFALAGEDVMQFGGKATVGRGRCRIIPVASAAANTNANSGGQTDA